MRALIGKGEGEEFIDWIGGLGAEPAERGAPAATRRENVGEELVGSDEIGPGKKRRQLVGGKAQQWILVRPPAQLVPQPTIAATVGETK